MGKCPEGSFCFQKEHLVIALVTIIVLLFYRQQNHSHINTYRPQHIRTIQTPDERPSTLFMDRVQNPLIPPIRSYPNSGVAINVPTRTPGGQYQQVGILVPAEANENKSEILPLFGKPTYRGSRDWLYYTASDQYNSNKLPVSREGKNCSGEYGCSEIRPGDLINVPPLNRNFIATIYELDKPRYIPYL